MGSSRRVARREDGVDARRRQAATDAPPVPAVLPDRPLPRRGAALAVRGVVPAGGAHRGRLAAGDPGRAHLEAAAVRGVGAGDGGARGVAAAAAVGAAIHVRLPELARGVPDPLLHPDRRPGRRLHVCRRQVGRHRVPAHRRALRLAHPRRPLPPRAALLLLRPAVRPHPARRRAPARDSARGGPPAFGGVPCW